MSHYDDDDDITLHHIDILVDNWWHLPPDYWFWLPVKYKLA
jgi:hypothetical protein